MKWVVIIAKAEKLKQHATVTAWPIQFTGDVKNLV